MKDKQQSYFVNIGSSSLLVIFLILCLVTFAVLSLSSAKSDYTFSERIAQHRQVYYSSSAKAEDIINDIDAILYETAKDINASALSGSFAEEGGLDAYDSYIFAVSSALNGKILHDITIACEQTKEDFLLSFQVPAGDTQVLQVVLQITDYRAHDNYYEIKTWKVVNPVSLTD